MDLARLAMACRRRTKGCGANLRGLCWKSAPSLGCQAEENLLGTSSFLSPTSLPWPSHKPPAPKSFKHQVQGGTGQRAQEH